MNFLNYVEKVTGVGIYGMISFFIFFSFFLLMSLWAWKADVKLIDTINNIPLDDSDTTN